MTPRPVTPGKLRTEIAETMWACVSAHDLKHACDALGMPAGPPDANPWDSKRRYVINRLTGMPAAELAEMARTVAAEYDAHELAALAGPTGLHGPDGELKNLIFAAHGPKPRIVLRDAINNVIEIVEHADKCLVYDRRLDHAGLAWGELIAWWTETAPDPGATPHAACTGGCSRRSTALPSRLCSRPTAFATGSRAPKQLPALIPQSTCTTTPTRCASSPGETAKCSNASGWTSCSCSPMEAAS